MVISTTWNHPFWVETNSTGLKIQKWTEVKDLRVGDVVTLKNKSEHPIKNIRQYKVPPTKVYNIEVENDHTYFVTKSDVLVHNYDPDKKGENGIVKYASFAKDSLVSLADSVIGYFKGDEEKNQLSMKKGETIRIQGDDGIEHEMTLSKDGKTKSVKVFKDGEKISEFSAWNREGQGRDKQFAIMDGPEHPELQPKKNESGHYSPLSGKIQVNDSVHGGKGSDDFPDTPAHRKDKKPIHSSGHKGSDYQVREKGFNRDLYANESGKVDFAGGYNTIILKYDSGKEAKYMHTSGIATNVYPGSKIKAGQYIGRAGGTGGDKGYDSHLHQEIRDKKGKVYSTDQVRRIYGY
ncbi:MAG: peptidoglycan DD-metalloendopeptidase family protein [Leptospiraceae bacterium]|nr:peptidoglycan DD-metalloendopeptidase family protein [Leptospiraceae bacterium]NUM41480.1 peptidoglycan DD-metalloendopeptidase family protein [Leptospiraceae bacterium]